MPLSCLNFLALKQLRLHWARRKRNATQAFNKNRWALQKGRKVRVLEPHELISWGFARNWSAQVPSGNFFSRSEGGFYCKPWGCINSSRVWSNGTSLTPDSRKVDWALGVGHDQRSSSVSAQKSHPSKSAGRSMACRFKTKKSKLVQQGLTMCIGQSWNCHRVSTSKMPFGPVERMAQAGAPLQLHKDPAETHDLGELYIIFHQPEIRRLGAFPHINHHLG